MCLCVCGGGEGAASFVKKKKRFKRLKSEFIPQNSFMKIQDASIFLFLCVCLFLPVALILFHTSVWFELNDMQQEGDASSVFVFLGSAVH